MHFHTGDIEKQPDDQSSGYPQKALRAECSPDMGFTRVARTFASVLMRHTSYCVLERALVQGSFRRPRSV